MFINTQEICLIKHTSTTVGFVVRQKNTVIGYSVSLVAGLSFGFIPIIIALLRDANVSVLEQLFLRLSLGGIMGIFGILGFFLWKKEVFSQAINKTVQATYVWQGFFFTIAIVVYIWSIVLDTPVGEASLLIQIHPLVTLILGAIFLNEVVNRRKISSIVLGITGLLLLTRPWEGERFLSSLLGDLLATLNGTLYAVYLVIGASSVKIRKKIPPSLSIFWVLVWGFIWGMIVIILLFIFPFESVRFAFDFQNVIKVNNLIFGALFAILGSILPYGLLMIANKFEVESSIQSILGLGEPIAAIFLGYIFLSEPITIWYFLGGVFLLMAILNILSTAE